MLGTIFRNDLKHGLPTHTHTQRALATTPRRCRRKKRTAAAPTRTILVFLDRSAAFPRRPPPPPPPPPLLSPCPARDIPTKLGRGGGGGGRGAQRGSRSAAGATSAKDASGSAPRRKKMRETPRHLQLLQELFREPARSVGMNHEVPGFVATGALPVHVYVRVLVLVVLGVRSTRVRKHRYR